MSPKKSKKKQIILICIIVLIFGLLILNKVSYNCAFDYANFGKTVENPFCDISIKLFLKPKGFEVMEHNYYARDNKHVFYLSRMISGANRDTFNVIGIYTAKDNKNVYYKGDLVEGADVNTFRIFEKLENFSIDKNNVYYKGVAVEGSDPASFRGVTQDKRFVCDGEIQFGSGDCKGANHYEDIQSIKYYKDKNFVYNINKGKLEGVNPKTFEVPDYDR